MVVAAVGGEGEGGGAGGVASVHYRSGDRKETATMTNNEGKNDEF